MLDIGDIRGAHVCNHGVAVTPQEVFVAGAHVSTGSSVVKGRDVVLLNLRGYAGADAEHFTVEERVEVVADGGLVASDKVEGGAVVSWGVWVEAEGLEELVGVWDGDEDGGGDAGEGRDGGVVVGVAVIIIILGGGVDAHVRVHVHVHSNATIAAATVDVVDDASAGALARHGAASSTAVIHAIAAGVVVGKVAFANDYDVAAGTALSGGSAAAVITAIGLLLLLLDLTSSDLFSYQVIQGR